MSGSAYLGDKAALETAREALSTTQKTATGAISAAQGTVTHTDVATQATLVLANKTLAGVAHGPEQGLVDSTTAALNGFIAANKVGAFRPVQKTHY